MLGGADICVFLFFGRFLSSFDLEFFELKIGIAYFSVEKVYTIFDGLRFCSSVTRISRLSRPVFSRVESIRSTQPISRSTLIRSCIYGTDGHTDV